MKKILLFICTLFLGLTLAGCSKSKETTTVDYVKDSEWRTPGQLINDLKNDDIDDKTQMSRVKLTLKFRDDDDFEYIGYMEFILFDTIAPKTVKNFKDLISIGFYDNTTITRIVTDVIIQGGDYKKTTTGVAKDAPLTIEGEFEENECSTNVLSHRRGVISMARVKTDLNSATSQFFVVANNFTACDGGYAAFGWLDSYTEEEKAVRLENGARVLYDYECLDKLTTLSIEDGTSDGAPSQTIQIVKAEIIDLK